MPVECNDEGEENGVNPGQDLFGSFNWVTDPLRKLAICAPPKTGSSTFQRAYLALAKNKIEFYLNQTMDSWVDSWDGIVFKRLPHVHIESVPPYDQRDGSYVFQTNWTRIIAARHPFERLYSSWKTIFSLENWNHIPNEENNRWQKYRNDIDLYELQASKIVDVHGGHLKKINIEEYMPMDGRMFKKPNIINQELWERKENMVTTFIAFLHYIASVDFMWIDPTFLPLSMTCQPCANDISYIAKIETLSDDITHAFNRVFNDPRKYCGKSKNNGGFFMNKRDKELSAQILQQKNKLLALAKNDHVEKSETKQIFSQIYQENSTLISTLFNKYKWDFTIFDYNLQSYIEDL